ncbi:MAG: polysaccharide export outer membrane protein [Polaribacter sp.]|jgi:polysaccharide export outer membrane protein
MKIYPILLLLLAFLCSCVSSKEVTYLQGNPASNLEIKRVNKIPYKLQIDDMLSISILFKGANIASVFVKDNSSGIEGGQGYSIDNYGNIRLPTLGEINVLGYTTLEVRKKIETKLRELYIKNDESLFVSVKLSGIKFTILGEDGASGTQIINQSSVSIIEAIANAGGISDTGNREEVEIIRKTFNGTEKFTVDLTDINILNSKAFFIQPNDIIIIKPVKESFWATGSLASQRLTSIISIFTLITTTIVLARNL